MMPSALQNLKETLVATIRRFPVSVTCSVLFTALACWMVHAEESGRLPHISSYLHILFFGCFWFIALKLLVENTSDLSRLWHGSAIGIFLAVAAYLYLDEDVTWFTPLFLCLGAFLLIFTAPYLARGGDNEHIWTFAYRLSMRIAFTFLAAVVLYLGAAAIIGSTQFLFGINFAEFGKVYFYIWIVVAALFSPIFAMAGIPHAFSESEETYPRFLRILVCNLIIPLWFVYAVVVYAYIGKIFFSQNLPKGGVAILVSIFAAKAIAIYFASYPLYMRKQTIAYWFSRHWPKLVILPLILLAVAIGERIRAHGVTEDRYTIVLCMAWVVIAMIERLRNEAKAPRRILIWAIGLLFATSFGPWGVDAVSTESQLSQLKGVLEKNHMISGGLIVPPKEPLTFADNKSISSAVDYLVDTHKLKLITSWFPAEQQSKIDEKRSITGAGYKQPAQVVVEAMGGQYIWRYQMEERAGSHPADNSKFFNYNSAWEKEAVSIGGYDYAIETSNYAEMCSVTGHEIKLRAEGRDSPLVFSLGFNPSQDMLTLVNTATKQRVGFDLMKLFKKDEWFKNSKGKLILESENSEMKARVIIRTANGRFDGDKPVINAITTLLLIKLK